jgi:hypothetical protein
MTKPHTPEQEAERLEGRARKSEDKLPTYQELLDEALQETFPASDPIAPGAAMHTKKPVKTAMDERDWKLEPQREHKPKSS